MSEIDLYDLMGTIRRNDNPNQLGKFLLHSNVTMRRPKEVCAMPGSLPRR